MINRSRYRVVVVQLSVWVFSPPKSFKPTLRFLWWFSSKIQKARVNETELWELIMLKKEYTTKALPCIVFIFHNGSGWMETFMLKKRFWHLNSLMRDEVYRPPLRVYISHNNNYSHSIYLRDANRSYHFIHFLKHLRLIFFYSPFAYILILSTHLFNNLWIVNVVYWNWCMQLLRHTADSRECLFKFIIRF